MSDKNSDLTPDRRLSQPVLPVSDYWFALIETRMSQLEAIATRMERLVWFLIYCGLLVAALEALRALVLTA